MGEGSSGEGNEAERQEALRQRLAEEMVKGAVSRGVQPEQLAFGLVAGQFDVPQSTINAATMRLFSGDVIERTSIGELRLKDAEAVVSDSLSDQLGILIEDTGRRLEPVYTNIHEHMQGILDQLQNG